MLSAHWTSIERSSLGGHFGIPCPALFAILTVLSKFLGLRLLPYSGERRQYPQQFICSRHHYRSHVVLGPRHKSRFRRVRGAVAKLFPKILGHDSSPAEPTWPCTRSGMPDI
jgi:hypothetical protein